MNVIEDSREILRDFIATELRAIDVRLAALEKRFEEGQARTDKQFERVDARFDKLDERFNVLTERLDRRFDQILAKIDTLAIYQDLQLRMTRLEALSGAGTPPVKKPESEAA